MDPIEQFRKRLAERAAAIHHLLDSLLSAEVAPGGKSRPPRLLDAMRHAVLNGGKRLRPFLLAESAAIFGAVGPGPLRAGAALECMHCYSLVHDDLPAMDDDDLRRGLPTVHRAFDEATAILAGDCLQSLAFDLLADPATHANPAVRIELVALLARASGAGGMAGGQMLDLEAEHGPLAPDRMREMQAMKTGALFRFACEAGAVLAGATQRQRIALGQFGTLVGTAFQLADDMLDVTASTSAMGKRTAKDARRGKATLVAVKGLEATRDSAGRLLDQALRELAGIGADTAMLEAAARYMIDRDS